MLAASDSSSAPPSSAASGRPPVQPEPAPARHVVAEGSVPEGAAVIFSSSSLPSLPYLPSLSSLASLLSSLPGLSSLPPSDLSPLTATLSALLSDSIENVVYHAKLFARHGGDWWHARDRDKERMESLTAQRSRQSAAAVSRQREEQKEEDDSLRDYIGFLSQLVKGGKAASPLVKAEREASSAAVLSGQRVLLRDEHFGVWDEKERKMVERIQQELAAAQRAKDDDQSAGVERKNDSSNSERKMQAGREESRGRQRAVREPQHSSRTAPHAPLSPSSPTFIPVSPPPPHHHAPPAVAVPSSGFAVPSSFSPAAGSSAHARPLSRPQIAHHSSAPLTHAVPTLSGWSAVVGRSAAVSFPPPASPPVSAPPVTSFGYFNPSTNLFVPSSREAPVVTSHAPPIIASLPHEDYLARASSFTAQQPVQHHSLQHPTAAAASPRAFVTPAPQLAVASLPISHPSPALAPAPAVAAQTSAEASAPSLPPVSFVTSPSLPPASLPSPPLSPSAPSPPPAEPAVVPSPPAPSSVSSAEIPVAPPLDDSVPVAPSLDDSIPEPPPLLPSSASSSRLPPPLSLSSSSSSSSKRCCLKRVHWSKLQYEHVQSSVWSQLLQADGQQGQGGSDGLQQLLDLSELQSKFASGGGLDKKTEASGQEKTAGKGGQSGDRAGAGKAGEEKGADDGAERRSEINASRGKASSVFRAIDALRAYNVEIAVSQLKSTAASIRDGLLLSHWQRGDAAIEQHLQLLTDAVSSEAGSPRALPAAFSSFPFTVDQLDILCRIVPTEEEAARTLSLPPSASSGSVENFFRVMSDIPRCKRRVELLAFLLSSSAELLSVAGSLSCLHAAHVAVTSSSSLPRFLALVLTVGNTLNAGSSQGEAYGFKLSWLREMQQVKTRDGSETLWQFCVQRHEQAEPAALEQQLAPVRAAAAIDTQALTAALHALAAMAGVGRREAALLPEDDAQRLLLLQWLPQYEQAVRAVELRCTRMAEEAVVLRRYLAEEEGSTGGGVDGGLVLLRDVLDLYVKAREETDRKRREGAQKERERGREKLKEERRQLSTSSLSTSRTTQPSQHGRGAAARLGARGGGVLRREKFVRIRPASPEPQSGAQAASHSSSAPSLIADPDPLGPL